MREAIRKTTRFLFSMFEEKTDGLRRLSMTRISVASFTLIYCIRLLRLAALGWPDAFITFVILFSLPISKALFSADPRTVVQAITGMFGKGEADTGGSYFHSESVTKTASTKPETSLNP